MIIYMYITWHGWCATMFISFCYLLWSVILLDYLLFLDCKIYFAPESCSGVQCPTGTWCARGTCSCATPCADAAREPVCAINGRTYPHECALQKAACEMRMRGETPLKVAYYGECTDSQEDNATAGKHIIIIFSYHLETNQFWLSAFALTNKLSQLHYLF